MEWMLFVAIGIIIIFILNYNRVVDTRKFIGESGGITEHLMEDDYEFLLTVRFPGRNLDVNALFQARLRNGVIAMLACFLAFALNMSVMYAVLSVIIGFFVFKSPYLTLQKYYKANLQHINTMLPYYLKSLEILVQHYTVPVALSRSIEAAPDVFKPGLRRLVAKIDEGDSSIQPYIDFANEYPVRDSMRMMRLLYRLGLGSQQNKHEQVMMFSRTVSALQNKAREQKYQQRLETMENKTLIMLICTGGGALALMFIAMMQMMNF